MTQITGNSSRLVIEDRLDAIGHKHRLVQIVRGALLWTGCAAGAALSTAIVADLLGQGVATLGLSVLLGVWLVASGVGWVVRPLFRRPTPVAVARLVEQRIDGLHNGLSNTVLLGQAQDLSQNPWLDPIFDEVLATCENCPLDSAVRFADLGPLLLRLAPLGVVIVLVSLLLPSRVAHGWQQMLAPISFIPRAGQTQIVDVQPGDVTLLTGQPLEIGVTTQGTESPPPRARIIFSKFPAADLPGDQAGHYAYRIDHVDEPLKYRVEVGPSQSAWYTVQIVPKVSLTSLDLKITPPAYTRLPVQTLTLKDNSPVALALGSGAEIGASIDMPAQRAVLLINSQPPQEMAAALANHRFYHQMAVAGDATIFVGILANGQIIAKLPETGVNIRSIPDSPPTVTMQWPGQDQTIPPATDLKIKARLHDDYGLTSARLLVSFGESEPAVVPNSEQQFPAAPTEQTIEFPLKLTAEQSRHDATVTVQVEATDNRDLTSISSELGPQSARGAKIVIRFQDPKQIALDTAQQLERLSARLAEMIRLQQGLRDKTIVRPVATDGMSRVAAGQGELRQMMTQTAESFEFTDQTRVIQKTLQAMALNTASDAVDQAAQIVAEPAAAEQARQAGQLQVTQESILETLHSLLARLGSADNPATRPDMIANNAMPSRVEAFKKLDEALKQYEKEQRRLLDQTAPLGKQPVADYDATDKKKLDDLRMAQDKLDAFMQEALADFSKNAEQDMSNPSLVKDLMQIYSQTTMIKDALSQKSAEQAIPLEENGLELAADIKSNIEKWLDNVPDRTAWTQEDPVGQNPLPAAELPKEMQDMMGDLLEQQEDLDQKMEDAAANWHDSMDTGIGWNAKDGPISDMSAKGITSNVLPNNNEMQGRSGEGRSGKSSGEFVGDQANGKGGRNTPTRLDPTPFQGGQIKGTDTDPAGGATGGGKITGQGAAGLEGPVPPKLQQEMQRLSKMQAQVRNAAERLNLQYKLGRYDNFKLLQSIVNMRRIESDLSANRYQNALHRTDVVVNDLTASGLLIGGGISVEQDTTPAATRRGRKEIEDAQQGDLPPVWSDSLREYYQKLSRQ